VLLIADAQQANQPGAEEQVNAGVDDATADESVRLSNHHSIAAAAVATPPRGSVEVGVWSEML
jgi:hypothetical protein